MVRDVAAKFRSSESTPGLCSFPSECEMLIFGPSPHGETKQKCNSSTCVCACVRVRMCELDVCGLCMCVCGPRKKRGISPSGTGNRHVEKATQSRYMQGSAMQMCAYAIRVCKRAQQKGERAPKVRRRRTIVKTKRDDRVQNTTYYRRHDASLRRFLFPIF